MMVDLRKSPARRTPEEWRIRAKGLLKAELVRRDISYAQLAQLLAGIGVIESVENLTNKINRGKFSAIFLLQCLEAIECKLLRVGDE